MGKYLVGVILVFLVAAGYEYYSAPVFWQRFINTLTTAGQGAYSPVFDVRETVAGSRQPAPLPAADRLSPEAVNDLIGYAQAYDSFSLLVLHRGKILLEWYRDDYAADSLTQSQSMHKTIQALLTGMAIEQGLITSVAQRIGDFIPEWNQDTRGDIRILDLLQMSSGLQNFTNSFNPWGDAFRWLFAADTRPATLQFPLQTTPGTVFDYNDLNAQLLGLVLSRASGQRYADWLQSQLWQPLGNDRAQVWLDQPGGEAMHACCLLATSRDWARIGLLMANQGRTADGRQLIPADWIAAVTRPNPLTPHYGYLTWIGSNSAENPRLTGYKQTEPWLAEDVFFLSGYGAQRVYVSPSAELVVVRLGPAAGYFPKIVNEWDNSYLFNRALRGLQSTALAGTRDD